MQIAGKSRPAAQIGWVWPSKVFWCWSAAGSGAQQALAHDVAFDKRIQPGADRAKVQPLRCLSFDLNIPKWIHITQNKYPVVDRQSRLSLFCVPYQPRIVVDPDGVSLRPESIWVIQRITRLRITALSASAVDIHPEAEHLAHRPPEGDVYPLFAGVSRRAEVGR